MLNTLRRSAGSWLAKLLFILLVISFAAWGIGDFIGPDVGSAVATVGDSEISDQEFSSEFNRELERLRQRFGGQLDRETAIGLGLADQVLTRLVSRKLLALEADELGLRFGDDIVRRRILDEEAFQGATGKFDRERFEQLLFANGLSEQGYVQRLRGELARGEVATAVSDGGTAPPDIATSLYKYREEQRVADLIFLPLTYVKNIPEPDEKALSAFYEESKSNFEKPEYRQLTAIVLTPEEVAADIDIPEERVREAYDNRIGEFGVPERRRVTQLLFSSEEAARSAAERLSTGAPFDDVAAEATKAGAQETEIGEIRRGELFPAAVEEAAFSLEKAGTTQPVETPLGWHILQVSDIQAGSTKPLEEVSTTIAKDLARDQAVERIYEIGNQLQDELAAGRSLEETAEKLGLRLEKIPAISRQGQAPDNTQVGGIPDPRSFLTEAFSLNSGEESLLEETPDGGYFVVRVDSVTPPVIPPLEDIRKNVATAWRGQKLADLAKEAAEKIAADIGAGAAFETVASEAGLEYRESPPFKRDANRPNEWLPAPLVARLSTATPEDVVVQRAGEGFYIGRVTDIRAADPAAGTEAIAQLQEQLDRSIKADLETQFSRALQARYGVEVRQESLQRLLR